MRVQIHYLSVGNCCNKIWHNINKWYKWNCWFLEFDKSYQTRAWLLHALGLIFEGTHLKCKTTNREELKSFPSFPCFCEKRPEKKTTVKYFYPKSNYVWSYASVNHSFFNKKANHNSGCACFLIIAHVNKRSPWILKW